LIQRLAGWSNVFDALTPALPEGITHPAELRLKRHLFHLLFHLFDLSLHQRYLLLQLAERSNQEKQGNA
jgi:hypothetical protein